MAPFTTFGIGGPARYLAVAQNGAAVERLATWASEQQLPWLVLGRGSNVLVDDGGYEGLVIIFRRREAQARSIEVNDLRDGSLRVRADAGTSLAGLARWCSERGLSGLEWACGIPGTLGGAVTGNAGAYGSSMSTVVHTVEVLSDGGRRCSYPSRELGFSYRHSVTLAKGEGLAVLDVALDLKRGDPESSAAKMAWYSQQRRNSQPKGRSAGCVFRNPAGGSAGALIEACGLKGFAIGDAVISDVHANFILNRGQARAEEVLRLMNTARRRVFERFGVRLESEIRFIGPLSLEVL